MAGISASEKIQGKDIVIIEKNQILGRKVLATGNGRCNFSNVKCSWEDYSKNGADLVKSVFKNFGPEETVSYFKSLGIYPRADEEGRLYPYSLEGASFVEALVDRLKMKQVNIRLGMEVGSVAKAAKGFEIKSSQGTIFSDKLIIATGGKAGLKFGSSGDGYGFAKKLGHSLIVPKPALVQIITEEGVKEKIKGVRVKGRVSLYLGDKNLGEMIAEENGEIQFFEEGLSGISVFELSRHLAETPERYYISLDLFPDLDKTEVMKILLDRKEKLSPYKAEALLATLIPEKLIPVYLRAVKISEKESIGQINKEKVCDLGNLLKERLYRVKATKGWVEAQVTTGGINISEVSSGTLESLICPGLFLAGELLDVDGPCGGWNLQWAWSSGYVAGLGAVE